MDKIQLLGSYSLLLWKYPNNKVPLKGRVHWTLNMSLQSRKTLQSYPDMIRINKRKKLFLLHILTSTSGPESVVHSGTFSTSSRKSRCTTPRNTSAQSCFQETTHVPRRVCDTRIWCPYVAEMLFAPSCHLWTLKEPKRQYFGEQLIRYLNRLSAKTLSFQSN